MRAFPLLLLSLVTLCLIGNGCGENNHERESPSSSNSSKAEIDSAPPNIHDHFLWSMNETNPQVRYRRLLGLWEAYYQHPHLSDDLSQVSEMSSDEFLVLARVAWELLEMAHVNSDSNSFTYYLEWLKENDSFVFQQLNS